MRNLFHRILSALNIKGRDWVVFLLALLLAFSIWLIHNLSLNYHEMFRVLISAESSIPEHAQVSANRCEVSARCKATGYKLIRAKISSRKTNKVVFRPSDLIHYEDDIYYITSSHLLEYSNQIFGQGVSVDFFLTDTLFFRFPQENSRKVPVVPISFLSFREQYMADGALSVTPDSVLIYGEPYQLENINSVYTRPIDHRDLAEDVTDLVALEKIKDIRFSNDQVAYSVKVKRFVEIDLTLPIKVRNVPQGKYLKVFPTEAKVSLRCNFPVKEDPERGISVEADYDDFVNSISGKCPLRLTGASREIINYVITPTHVSGLVEELR